MSDVLHISLHNLHTFERNWKGGSEFGTDDLVDKQGFSLHAHVVSERAPRNFMAFFKKHPLVHNFSSSPLKSG